LPKNLSFFFQFFKFIQQSIILSFLSFAQYNKNIVLDKAGKKTKADKKAAIKAKAEKRAAFLAKKAQVEKK
jgi:hypothetical protein